MLAALAAFFDFVAVLFRVRSRFGDFATPGFAAVDAACCRAGGDPGFFRRASRCLFLSRK